MESRPEGQPPSAHHLLAGAAFIAVIAAGEFLPQLEITALRWAGALLLVASTGLWIPPFVHLTRHGAPDPERGFTHTTRLVRKGLYSVVRHPQYLGYMIMTLGFVLTGLNTVSGAAGGVAVASFVLAARAEDRYLLRQMGEEYAAYEEEVPAFDLLRGWLRRRRRQGNAPGHHST